jgi:hypothetical protein
MVDLHINGTSKPPNRSHTSTHNESATPTQKHDITTLVRSARQRFPTSWAHIDSKPNATKMAHEAGSHKLKRLVT